VRFVFSPPADEAAGLLTLPWSEPLEDWRDDRLVEIRMRGISRHIVRFAEEDGELYALKSIDERLARREYRLLRGLADASVPAVEVVGIVVDRGLGADAILVTRFLDYSTTYRALFSNPRGGQPTDRLLDAMVELLVRLHLSGFFWGDCSLSNTLFRFDAGALEAYLVDSETSEQHPSLTDGQRNWDLELAWERVGGELLDLQAGDLLPPEIEPFEVADELRTRYERLWQELTREEILRPDEQRYRIAERLRRLNELGFDADEVELVFTVSLKGSHGPASGDVGNEWLTAAKRHRTTVVRLPRRTAVGAASASPSSTAAGWARSRPARRSAPTCASPSAACTVPCWPRARSAARATTAARPPRPS